LGGLIRWYVNTQDDKAAAEHEVEQMYTNNKCSIEGTKESILLAMMPPRKKKTGKVGYP
jgi:hypothetical protein